MAEGQDAEDKTEDPTGRKLSQAREQGDVPKSQDIPTVMSLAAGAGVIMYGLSNLSAPMMGSLVGFWAHAGEIRLDGPTVIGLIPYLGKVILPVVGAVAGAATMASLMGNIGQNPPIFNMGKLKFDFSKLDVMAGIKKLFSAENLIQFLKSALKMVIVTWSIFSAAKPIFDRMEEFAQMEVVQLLPVMRDLAVALLMAALIAFAGIAVIDYIHQRFAFMKRQRMSREDIKEEHKMTDGDPHVKAKLRQLRMAKSRQRMMQRVPEATVVITNPTHYAVALKYDEAESDAPICIAKGVDALALRIRAVATEANVEIVEDPPLARALYASVDIDEVIPAEHFKAVAKIIGVIYRRKRAGVA
jgi:flagellar biosynthetic protein FlhB